MMRHALAIFVAVACLAHVAAAANHISGNVKYEDHNISPTDGTFTKVQAPARFVLVQVASNASLTVILGSGRTDTNGDFGPIEVTGDPADAVVIVQANGTTLGQTVIVKAISVDAIQAHVETTPRDLSGGDVTGVNILIDGVDIAGAFDIIDTFTKTWEVVHNNLFVAPPTDLPGTITCHWEFGEDPTEGITYFTLVNSLPVFYILGDEAADSDAFDDDVLQHEYAHFMAWKYSKDDSPGGRHTQGAKLDIRMAFSEAWGNAFSCIISDQLGQASPSVYVDTMAAPALIIDFSSPGASYRGSEDELACSALLWKVYYNDTANPLAPYDQAGWPAGVTNAVRAMWMVFDEYLPTAQDVSMEDFWDGWFVNGFDNQPRLISYAGALGIGFYADNQEPDNTKDQARQVTVSDTSAAVAHTYYFDPNNSGLGVGDADWVKFAATNGTIYDIATQNLTNAADTVLQLYASDGTTLVIENDDRAAGNLASHISYTATADGTLYVRSARATKRLPGPDATTPGATGTYGSYELVIRTGLPDTQPPTVTSVTPLNAATNVSILTNVVINFSEPVKASTVTATSFTLAGPTGTAVTATVTLDTTGTKATLDPNTSLLAQTQYTVTVSSAITDLVGLPLTRFTSTFTTGTGTPVVGNGDPPGKVPYARAYSGDGRVDVVWKNPTTEFAAVIVAAGSTRFPTLTLTVDAQGNANFTIEHGSEVYRGTDKTQVQVPAANRATSFISIWAVNGEHMSGAVSVSATAVEGARGLTVVTSGGEPVPPKVNPTISRISTLRAAAGDGFIDLEWDTPAAGIDGVIVASGADRFPRLVVQTDNAGTQTLAVDGGQELFRGTDRNSGRAQVTNGSARFFNVWTYKGVEVSRSIAAESRAVNGGSGITAQSSRYGKVPENFQGGQATGTTTGTGGLTPQQLLDLLRQLGL